MGTIKKRTVVEHLDRLIEFYKGCDTKDERLRTLIVRNLGDVKRRAIKEEAENKSYPVGKPDNI